MMATNDKASRSGDGIALSLNKEIAEARRAMAENLLVFAKTYLPHYFTEPESVFHRELASMLEEAIHSRGKKIAVAAPRGYAKSTLCSLAAVLWGLAYGHEAFVCIMSDTLDLACNHLRNIRDEVETNVLLQNDFPEIFGPSKIRTLSSQWSRDAIEMGNGALVKAFGAGQNVRGYRKGNHRPSLVIMDDIEDSERVRSSEQRRKLRDWLARDVLSVGNAETNFVMIGTILHPDSLLANLVEEGEARGWHGRKYKAIVSPPSYDELWEFWEECYRGIAADDDGNTGPETAMQFYRDAKVDLLKGTDVLWPEHESYLDLMLLRIVLGRGAFASEKMNEPTDPSSCLFTEEDFVFWDDEFQTEEELLASLGRNARIIGACDPSMGRKGAANDDSAIVALLEDTRRGTLYVLDADIRRRKPEEIISSILTLHKVRKFQYFGIESVQFQEFLLAELQRRASEMGLRLPAIGIRPTSDKIGRIQRLQPLITSGQIRFRKRHAKLMEQLLQFPTAAHDDGPDALEMAVRVADKHRARNAGRIPMPCVGTPSDVYGQGGYGCSRSRTTGLVLGQPGMEDGSS